MNTQAKQNKQKQTTTTKAQEFAWMQGLVKSYMEYDQGIPSAWFCWSVDRAVELAINEVRNKNKVQLVKTSYIPKTGMCPVKKLEGGWCLRQRAIGSDFYLES